ncbi:uromodulin-like 1 [Leuresthes tenuis]|uniref:uromodulin-like 1 n=1 Tax=Leuresthes tenuis TaxID=355514 RepID=UPI003B50ECDB
MSWLFSIWVAEALLALCGGQNTVVEGNSLSLSGYHLCTRNETRTVSSLVVHTVPYSVTKPCGGWLLWTTCTVTLYKMVHQVEYKTVKEQVTRCCNGYVQVGRYCALSVNRSGEFTAKPGSCPISDGLCPRSENCEFDIDCPGWQKCCQRSGRTLCSDPTSSGSFFENRGSLWNATVTVKTDYQQLMSKENGLLNLTRILHAMVTGALQSEVSIYYLNSWPLHPFRTTTSLLIESSFTLSMYNVTSKLHFLLKHIPEVSSVTVQDVDECAHPALHQCSLQADCNNTMGSYQCFCHQGYFDVDPNEPGVNCTADIRVPTTTEPPLTHLPLTNTTSALTFNRTQDPPENGTMGIFISSETNMTTALRNTSSVANNLSHAPLGTTSAPYTSMSSAAESPLPSAACPPPSIISLWSANITGASISVFWSSQFHTNQTFRVTLSREAVNIHSWETSQMMIEIIRLQSGVLYNVSVTPCICGGEGVTHHMLVRTDAQTLDATTRLTNIQFTADLRNTSSPAYRNLKESFIEEIYQTLSPDVKEMLDSGGMRIEIRGFSLGSVVVDFTIIFSPNQSQGIRNVSTALLHSLLNSSKYTVDINNTSISDFNECDSGDNDCSQWATCINTWTSYTCVCHEGFIDNNPERSGRNCQANATLDTAAPPMAILPTVSTTPISQIIPSASDPAITPVSVTREVESVFSQASTTSTITSTTPSSITTTTAPTTVFTAPSVTTTTPTTITIPAIPNNVVPIHSSSQTSTFSSTSTPRAAVAPTINSGINTTIAAPTTTVTTSAVTPIHTITTTLTTTMASTVTAATPTITSLALRSAANVSMIGVLSVQCRIAAITVTVARDFLGTANIQESALYLGMLGCGVNGGNATHVQLTVAWDECGTRLVHNETYYTASVTLFNKMDPYASQSGTVEVPRLLLQVPIMCTYTKSMLISTDFGSMGYQMIKDVIRDFGSFQVMVQLMNGTAPLHQNYSLSPEQALVVEVSLNSTSEKIKVVINKCWATPTQNPADTYSYTFIENSCSRNIYTQVLMNGNSTTSRVSVQIFSFVNLNVIYIHCQVQICVQIGSDACVPDCLQRTARTANTIRTAYGSSGPVRRLDEGEWDLEEKIDILHIVGFSCLGIGLSLFFIFGFICLFYYQRNRIGHYNFNTKPKQENFTYLDS